MNSLVGYGSSDSEGEDLATPATLTNGIIPPKVSHKKVTTSQPYAQETDTSHFDKKLAISDDEDNYVVRKASSSSLSDIPKSNLVPPKLESILQVIEKAQIVKVPADSLQYQDGALSSLLPKPKPKSVQELELETLHRRKRMKKDKKRIFALNLNDFEEAEEEKPKAKRPASSSSKCNLFSILPEPKNCKIGTKSSKSVLPSASLLKPRTLKTNSTVSNTEEEIVINEVDAGGSDFFSFSKSERESHDLKNIASSIKLDKFVPKQITTAPETLQVPDNLRSIDAITPSGMEFVEVQPEPLQIDDDVPSEFRDLKFNSTEIIDVNQEIQSTAEWALKNLDYSDSKPQSSTKCPVGGQTKRKNQISYLAWKAKEKESELQNMWANNKMNRYATQNRYGFR